MFTLDSDSKSQLSITKCEATKDIHYDWITFYEIANADLPILDQVKQQVRSYHTGIVPKLKEVIAYQENELKQNPFRTTNFIPNDAYELLRIHCKGTSIEFLRAKKPTSRTLFFVST